MERIAFGLVLLALLVTPASVAVAEEDEWGVRFGRIVFNPTGPDTAENDHLNREYILIRNDTNQRKNVRGWMVRDLGGEHVYKIDRRLILRPGDYIRLHTGRAGDTTAICIDSACPAVHDLHWRLDEYVWENDRDRARLVRPDGSRADRCGYGRKAHSPKRC